ncbi:SRPBCC family protein [Actinorugispora endophytica]|uniref:Putative membrane protein n=1 Tax=Actinorugispora endophytica TaxID=1605990 RepID=A0A4R6V4W5_9ACTN|nr:SRPBCC family protein [Actinorugispora endophytica]TDQ55381.1 putative membrane protein [Actinorugispora endophytica]
MADEGTGPLGRLREAAGRNPGTERLLKEAERYVSAKAGHAVRSTTRRLGEGAERMAEGEGVGSLLKGGRKLAEGKGVAGAVAEAGKEKVKDTVKDKASDLISRLTGGGGGGGSVKATNIVENIDVGVPVRVAYDQWTRFPDFSKFTKGVQSVERNDDVSSNWKMKVFLSARSWEGKVSDQIPDERIAWTSEGGKGTTKGVVTFHALGENLTRILVVVEYYPKGLFERTGNIWRAQGRRLRLDLKHFRRHVMMRSPSEEVEGWRGEIRDGEVVREHEDALAEEERGGGEDEYEEEPGEGEYEDEYEGEPGEGEYEEEEEEPEGGEEPEEDDEEAEDEEEPQESPRRGRR